LGGKISAFDFSSNSISMPKPVQIGVNRVKPKPSLIIAGIKPGGWNRGVENQVRKSIT
jgi:hypothetical protein